MQNEPVALTTAIAVVLYNVANALGVVVDVDTAQALVVSVIAVVTAVLARRKVTPV